MHLESGPQRSARAPKERDGQSLAEEEPVHEHVAEHGEPCRRYRARPRHGAGQATGEGGDRRSDLTACAEGQAQTQALTRRSTAKHASRVPLGTGCRWRRCGDAVRGVVSGHMGAAVQRRRHDCRMRARDVPLQAHDRRRSAHFGRFDQLRPPVIPPQRRIIAEHRRPGIRERPDRRLRSRSRTVAPGELRRVAGQACAPRISASGWPR